MSKYGVFFGPYFLYLVSARRFTQYISVFNPNTAKYGSEKTPCLDIFLAVHISMYVPFRFKFSTYTKADF